MIKRFMDWWNGQGEATDGLCRSNVPRCLWVGGDGTAGMSVNPQTALSNPTFYAGTRRVAEQFACLPLLLLRETMGGGKEKAVNDPRFDVLRWQWNDEQTSVVAREFMCSQLVTYGNAFAEIEWNNARTQFLKLWTIPSFIVRVRRHNYSLKWTDAFGNAAERQDSRIVYDISLPEGIRTLEAQDILHVQLVGDGLCGYSPVELGRAALGLDKALQQHNAALMENACTPSGYWEHPGQISDDALANLKKSWDTTKGAKRAGYNLLLEEGMKYHPATIEPEKAQLHESRQFSVIDLCRVQGGLQPHMVSELGRSTWNNIEQQSIDFVSTMLRPIIIKFEQEMMLKLLTPEERKRYCIEHLMDELLRGDTLTRYQAYQIGLQNGFLTKDEVRVKENLNPLPPESAAEQSTDSKPETPKEQYGDASQPDTNQQQQ